MIEQGKGFGQALVSGIALCAGGASGSLLRLDQYRFELGSHGYYPLVRLSLQD
ncbi:hypothetical protein D3C75_1107260 [compost metagenome]